MFAPVKRILTEEDIQTVYDASLRVLDEVGILCAHEKAAEMLVENGGARYEGGRLFLEPDATAALFEERKADFAQKEQAAQAEPMDFSMGGQWNCLELCDPETNMPRSATVAEAVDMAKLAVSLGALSGPIPVAPGTVAPRLRTLECERIALVHTESLGGWLTATDNDEIRILADMNLAAGRRFGLGLEGLITPLKLNPVIFDSYFKWCEDPDVDIGIMGGIPVAGSTAPLAFPACLVLPLAEGLALDFIFKSLSGGRHRCWNVRLEPFDMRWTNLAFGTPEQCLVIQAVAELMEGLFGVKPRSGVFRTNGKCVEAQTMLERTACFLWQASLGARRFGSVGQMSMDEVYSPVQAVLDGEILEYGRRLFEGVSDGCRERGRDIVEIVREGVEDSGFLMHDTTVSTFREFYGFNRLSEASNLSVWRSRGSKTLEAKAWEEAQRLIKAYDWQLEAKAAREVEKIYRKGLALLEKK